MGPGMTGQLVEMARSDPETARSCLACHAPLAEQQSPAAGGSRAAPSQGFDLELQAEGLVCAGCHVRRHERFGPPLRGGSFTGAREGRLPHGGATRTSAFLRSEFCSGCHQFGPDGFALNGKLLENTFEEWKASPAARRGLHCQDCHMPDRRHLWRGIHDRDMVQSGLEFSLGIDRPRVPPGEQLVARLTVTSVNVGHYFPTYVTPRVVVRMELVDRAGRMVPRTREEHIIGRQVSLDLSRELSDTRIPPGGQAAFEYRRGIDALGLRLRATVTVFPDHFYSGFFRSLLATGAGAGAPEIRRALDAAQRSSFEIFRREIPVS